ncbi:MAG TPA: hypothetical protein PLD84_05855 [Chitinophagales bacterium]|nr:hypothetical protein [Chitinophagales bacterium]
MIEKISRTEEIEKKLSDENKVTYFDSPADIQVIKTMNDEMEEINREYKVKEKNSQISASEVILTS